jgi:hypothetical protein
MPHSVTASADRSTLVCLCPMSAAAAQTSVPRRWHMGQTLGRSAMCAHAEGASRRHPVTTPLAAPSL